MDAMTDRLAAIEDWGAEHVAASVIRAGGERISRGDPGHSFRWASVTKLATALAVLIGIERGFLTLDEAAGPPGATVRHLLAHASGLPFEGDQAISAPGRRRIYSNTGYDTLGAILATRTGQPFGATLGEWVLDPLGMGATDLADRPSDGLRGTIGDAAALASEWLRPAILTPEAHALATSVAFPGLVGVVPGVGRFDPCDWGLGPEIHGAKSPHWMGTANSRAAFGHFGGSGTFLWVDPAAGIALVGLADREYGPWALDAWPALSDAVLAARSIA